EDGIRAFHVTGVQTCALPISCRPDGRPRLDKTRLDKTRLDKTRLGNARLDDTGAKAGHRRRRRSLSPDSAIECRTRQTRQRTEETGRAAWREGVSGRVGAARL